MFFLESLNEQWVHLFHNLYEAAHISRWEKNLNRKKLEILLKSSIDYLDHYEREAIFVYHLRAFFKDLRHDRIGLKEIVLRCKNLLTMAEKWEHDYPEKSSLRSLGQSYLLFILTLNDSSFSPTHQRKVLKLAYSYAMTAQQIIKNADHPYFNLLFCLIHIASNKWSAGTKELHALAKKYPDQQLYKILVQLYLKIGLPNVSRYFQKKLNAHQDTSKSHYLTLYSNLSSFSNLA